jgi:hypothetical protein
MLNALKSEKTILLETSLRRLVPNNPDKVIPFWLGELQTATPSTGFDTP